MQKKKNISSELNYKKKEKYRGKKDIIHKKKEEKKPKQRKDK
jgi:hypothetical protein